jgi:hypothetical protein
LLDVRVAQDLVLGLVGTGLDFGGLMLSGHGGRIRFVIRWSSYGWIGALSVRKGGEELYRVRHGKTRMKGDNREKWGRRQFLLIL